MYLGDDELIECRDCGNKTATIITVDEIPCTCGEIIKVYYISCTCGYSYRMAGDVFLDGNKIDIDTVGKFLDEVTDFFDSHNIFDKSYENKPMESLIHRCLKCNELATEWTPGKYKCTMCGFSWEVDPHE